MLSKRNPSSEKATYCTFPFTWNMEYMQIYGDRIHNCCLRMVGGGGKEWQGSTNEYKISLRECEIFLHWDSGEYCITLWIY